jgi:N-glycosylase/DNA lyase
MTSAALPDHLRRAFTERRSAIQQRLQDFAAVAPSQYFYEACYCLCTPQSKAVHANDVVHQLQDMNFLEAGGDPEPLLREPSRYIRFHATKARRLLRLREQWTSVADMLAHEPDPRARRAWLVQQVDGYGMKEASHFLRNIGDRGLTILDRHLLKNLVVCHVFKEIPRLSTRRQYEEVEQEFLRFAQLVDIDVDELDLLFWSEEAGMILK